MPRIAVLPDADTLREGIAGEVFYLEAVAVEDLDDLKASEGILERLERGVRTPSR